MIDVHIIPILSDNYSYILVNDEAIAVVDPGDGQAMVDALNDRNLMPEKILITHHHGDHTAGIKALEESFGCKTYGPAAEAAKIPHLDYGLAEGQTVMLGDEEAIVLATPGHTRGHIAYWFEQSGLLFAGDTLFSMGCGRLLEGTAEQMHASLARFAGLPDDTKIYCGHEYTQTNTEFALSVTPDDAALAGKLADVKKKRANDLPTLPSTIAHEKALNPFMRCQSADALAALRRQKDRF